MPHPHNIYVIGENGTPYNSATQTIILQAALKIGQALKQKSIKVDNKDQLTLNLHQNDTYGYMTFRRVMVADSTPLSSDINDSVIGIVFYSQRPSIDCQTYNLGGLPADATIPQEIKNAIALNTTYKVRTHQSVIGCSTGIIPTEYTFVHEFGHVFDGMSTAQGLYTKINGTQTQANQIQDTPFFCYLAFPGYPNSCPYKDSEGKSFVVMGQVNRDGVYSWIRGDRGWGSANSLPPPAAPTNFQQHSPPYNTLLEAMRETSADMFLNWVYRMNATQGLISNDVPGTWGGFLNKSWDVADKRWNNGNCGTGCNDFSLPGNARFIWMETQLTEFFKTYHW